MEPIVREEPPPSALPAVSGPGADWRRLAGHYAEPIALVAARHDLEPALLAAVAKVESNFDPFAVSHKGACGILQLLPETAQRFGVDDLFDLEQNLDGGARYLRWLLDRFEGDTELALAAYNAGENAVDRYGGIPPYPETKAYVVRVLKRAR
jgi:soluble lytic murein transglycosylase-like protein